MKLIKHVFIVLSLLAFELEASHAHQIFHPHKLLKKEELSTIAHINANLHNKKYHEAHNHLLKLKHLIKIRGNEFEKMIPDIIDPKSISRQIQVTKSKFFDAVRYLRKTTESWLELYTPLYDEIIRKTAYEFAQNINNKQFTWDQAKRLLMDNDVPNTLKLHSDIIDPLLDITFILRSVELDFAVAHLRDYYYIRTDHSHKHYHHNSRPPLPMAPLTPAKLILPEHSAIPNK